MASRTKKATYWDFTFCKSCKDQIAKQLKSSARCDIMFGECDTLNEHKFCHDYITVFAIIKVADGIDVQWRLMNGSRRHLLREINETIFETT